MKKLILPILILSLALNAALSFAVWSAPKGPARGGAEAATMAKLSGQSVDHPQLSTKPSTESSILFPIKGNYWLTSEFGIRKSPFTGKSAVHYGTDYGAPKSAEIQAVKDGIVVTHWPPPNGHYSGHPIYGGYIEILHDDGISRYAHMSETFVHEGDRVKAGQVIGIIGATGMVSGKTGRHLHFEFLKNAGDFYD